MFEKFIKRENDIFEILQSFIDSNLDFVLVGGYAVSAFKHRFSVDADVVVRSGDVQKFENLLSQNGFKKTISKELENLYSTVFIRYEKKNDLSIYIDLLVGGMGVRQTNSSISFEKINENSVKNKIKGLEREIIAKIPVKELLIALKLQAGRLTDFRDIATLIKDTDISKIKLFLKECDKNIVASNIKNLISLLDRKEFIDSFKGVFLEKKYDIDINKLKNLKYLID